MSAHSQGPPVGPTEITYGAGVAVCTADLSDAEGDRLLPCSLPWRSYGAVTSFVGTVATVRCLDDNGLVRDVLCQRGQGRVLVVDGGGSLGAALFGDGLGALALQNGWCGVVINGAVRDVVGLADLRIGVLALGTNPRRGQAAGTGEQGVPVCFGGVSIAPGCRLFADPDGVLVESSGGRR